MKLLKSLLAAACLAFAATAGAADLVDGRDYATLKPAQPTENTGKIEVLEFFSYGCNHCADFNPLLSAWAAKQPKDVAVRKVPVSFGRAQWANIAKLYYALEAMGELQRLDGEAFKAIHVERLKLFSDDAITAWVAQKGVDTKKFAEYYGSFGIASKVQQGDQMAKAYKIEGVPTLAVNGKYMVLNNGLGGYDDLLARVDKLVAKERAEQPKGKK